MSKLAYIFTAVLLGTGTLAAGIPQAADAARHASPRRTTVPQVISLDGLGTLRLGQRVPRSGPWMQRKPVNTGCGIIRSSAYPGVYALVEQGRVTRITAERGSSIRLYEGVRVGSTERAVMDAFPGFRADGHKYVSAPAKDIGPMRIADGEPGVRFETGRDRRVTQMHVGLEPALNYTERCG